MKKMNYREILLLSIILPLWCNASDTGTIKMRTRLEMTQPKSKNKFSIAPTRKILKPFSKGTGANVSSSFFFNDKIASELTLGVNCMKLEHAADVANVFTGTGNTFSNKKSYFFPVSLGAQYYPIKASFFNMYVGSGVNYTFITNNKNANIRNSSGVFAQTGIDIYNPKTIVGFNFDIKKYWQKVTLKYKTPTVSSSPLKNKAAIDPWVFSTGLFYEF